MDCNIFDLRWFRKTHTSCILNMQQRHLLQPSTTHNTHPTHTMHTDLHANTLYAESTYTHMCTHMHTYPCTHTHTLCLKNLRQICIYINIKGCIFLSENIKYYIMKTSITLSFSTSGERRDHFRIISLCKNFIFLEWNSVSNFKSARVCLKLLLMFKMSYLKNIETHFKIQHFARQVWLSG